MTMFLSFVFMVVLLSLVSANHSEPESEIGGSDKPVQLDVDRNLTFLCLTAGTAFELPGIHERGPVKRLKVITSVFNYFTMNPW